MAYGEFSASHEWKFRWLLQTQRIVPRVPPRLLNRAIAAMQARAFVDWTFGHYLAIAPPEFASADPAPRPLTRSPARVAA